METPQTPLPTMRKTLISIRAANGVLALQAVSIAIERKEEDRRGVARRRVAGRRVARRRGARRGEESRDAEFMYVVPCVVDHLPRPPT